MDLRITRWWSRFPNPRFGSHRVGENRAHRKGFFMSQAKNGGGNCGGNLPNKPSTTGNPSGDGRSNNPPGK